LSVASVSPTEWQRLTGVRVTEFLEHEVWPDVPRRERGHRLSRQEEDEILGYGEHGL
jgi:hypothetical protein